MRIKHRYLSWDSHSKKIRPVKLILDRYSLMYKYKEDPNCAIPSFAYQIEFFLYEDDPQFSKIKQELDRFLEPNAIATEYEKSDIINAEWFIVNTGAYQYPQPEDDYESATYNLQNFCAICGIGKIQNAPFRLRMNPKQLNNQFWGLHWAFEAIFVREETKHILEREAIKGIRFSNPVIHKSNTPIEGFYQLHVESILPIGFDPYNTNTITCKYNNEENLNTDKSLPYCGRIKYHHPRIGGYLFDKSIFNSEFDIVQSHEYFGSGGSANRLQIVSRKFKDIVETNKLRGLSFIPVNHIRFERWS